MKKNSMFFLLILFLFSNIFLLYKSYKNKTYPYYELGFLYRKLDREIKKITLGKENYKSSIINSSYTSNSKINEKYEKIDSALLPLKIDNLNINKFVKFAKKGGAISLVI